ncbi:Asp-tRNA(Asn)/Glu-tRNA(Gln) amidotransferase A subunit family amidase [Amorphus suaedae]
MTTDPRVTTRRKGLAMAVVLGAGLAATAAAAQEDPRAMTVREAAAAIRAGQVTSVQLVEALAKAAEAHDDLNAFITLDVNAAEAAAAEADERLARDEAADQPLLGVPLVIKDNIIVKGLPTTGGTPALETFVSEANAPVIERLEAAGAIILGKTNMHELAFGITSANAHFGAVGNAYDATRSAGGSSGGTGAAVAAHLAPGGLGTDTGGSVRIPAAFNGIAGLRPTVGRYPTSGIVPISHTRDTPGPIARTVDDLVLLDGAITGGATVLDPVALDGVRLGVAEAFTGGLSKEVQGVWDAAVAKLEAAGATLVPVEMPDVMALNEQIGFPVALYEVARDLPAFLDAWKAGASLQDVADGVASPDVKFVFDNFVVGDKQMPEAAYAAAIGVLRPQLQTLYAETFAANHLDALVFPTTILAAPPKEGSGETVDLDGTQVPTFQTYIRNTDPGSNAGLPGLTLPIGLTDAGLPVGLELDGPGFTDRRLLAIGLAMEDLFGTLPPPAVASQ